jgi:flagellar motility protein MotE (MotC chaperone)
MENNKQDYGRFQWFFFVVLIPLLFTVTLIVVILTVSGYDVLGKMKDVLANITGVEKLVEDKQGMTSSNPKSDIDKKVEQLTEVKRNLEKTIEEQVTMIAAYEKDLSNSEKEIQNLNQEIKSLEEQIEDINNAESKNKSKDIAKLYGKMSSKKAAEIIPKLKEADAMHILTSLDDKQVADILTKMTIDDSVKYTNMLASTTE